MRIAVDANVLEANWGGIPKHVHRVTRELAGRGDHVDLLANLSDVAHFDVTVPGTHPVALRLRGRSLWREVALPLWLRRRRPDVLWAPEGILPRFPGVPTVVTVHDLAPLLFAESKPGHEVKEMERGVRRSVLHATRVICVSEATAADVERLFRVERAKLRVIGNGVDGIFTPGEAGPPAGVPEPFVLHVGSIEPRKGLDVLIDASRGAGWTLVLAGRLGPGGEPILASALEAGTIHLDSVGDEELVSLYRSAAVVAAPALYEGFGIVPLEAMACATPVVVASPAGALAEVAGDAAVHVTERSPEAWRSAIDDALDRRATLVDRGLRRAAGFRWPVVAAAVREVFEEAAATRA